MANRGSFLTRIARLRRPRLLSQDSGATAVEVALAGSLFLLIVCVIIELDLILFTQSVLDNATRDASRLIRTGQVQLSGGVSVFKSRLCGDIGTIIPCTGLEWNVQSASKFSSLNPVVQTNSGGDMTNTQFQPGGPGSDVLVQVGYKRASFIPWVIRYFGTHQLLISTVAFQNDQYQ